MGQPLRQAPRIIRELFIYIETVTLSMNYQGNLLQKMEAKSFDCFLNVSSKQGIQRDS